MTSQGRIGQHWHGQLSPDIEARCEAVRVKEAIKEKKAIKERESRSEKAKSENKSEFVRAISKFRPPAWITMKDEVVISGVAGIYPSSLDVSEFMENLFAGVDMVQAATHQRWPSGYWDLPEKNGTIPSNCEFFDYQFFGVDEKDANLIDFQTRLLLEKVYEAICDSGKCF